MHYGVAIGIDGIQCCLEQNRVSLVLTLVGIGDRIRLGIKKEACQSFQHVDAPCYQRKLRPTC